MNPLLNVSGILTLAILSVWTVTDLRTRTIHPYLAAVPLISGVASWGYLLSTGIIGVEVLYTAALYTGVIVLALLFGGSKLGDVVMVVSIFVGAERLLLFIHCRHDVEPGFLHAERCAACSTEQIKSPHFFHGMLQSSSRRDMTCFPTYSYSASHSTTRHSS